MYKQPPKATILVQLIEGAERLRAVTSDMVVRKRVSTRNADEVFRRIDGTYERWKVSMQSLPEKGDYLHWQFALDLTDDCAIPSGDVGYFCSLDDVDEISAELDKRFYSVGWYSLGKTPEEVDSSIQLVMEAICGPVRAHLDAKSMGILASVDRPDNSTIRGNPLEELD